jgi:hypothetical protein
VDLAHQPSDNLIETAARRKTVAAEYSVSGRIGLSDCRNGRRIHEGMCWGAAAVKRTARQPRKKDRDNQCSLQIFLTLTTIWFLTQAKTTRRKKLKTL